MLFSNDDETEIKIKVKALKGVLKDTRMQTFYFCRDKKERTMSFECDKCPFFVKIKKNNNKAVCIDEMLKDLVEAIENIK